MIVSRTQMPWLTGLHELGSTSRSIAQETLASPDDDVILSDIGLLSRRRADSLAIRVAARNNHRHPVRPRRA